MWVLLKADGFECLCELPGLAAVIDSMRPPKKSHDSVSVASFIEDHFRVACSDDLTPGFSGNFSDRVVDLPLAKNLQVGIWFVKQQNRTWIGRMRARFRLHRRF